jgi:hypothetical protein
MSRTLGPQIFAYHTLFGRECLPEYVSCDVLARIETTLLNKLMGRAGQAENVGRSGNEVASTATFSLGSFLCILSVGYAERFHRVLGR